MKNTIKIVTLVRSVNFIKFLLYGFLLMGLYQSALIYLVKSDWGREGYSYCYIIPFVVLYLLWRKKDEFIVLPSVSSFKGFVPFFIGLLLFWIGELGGEYLTLYLSFWLVIVGILWIHLGWPKLKTIGFALIFMLTMFPLPNFLNTRLMLKLRLISSEIGVNIIKMVGLPVYREGNIIDLGFTQLQVVEACSGLHSLISLVVLCLLLVHFFKAHWWKRTILLASSVPLAIFTNSLRISLTAILYRYFGEEISQGFFHGFSGLLIFGFCIPFLFLWMRLLEKLPPTEKKPSSVASLGPEDYERTSNSLRNKDHTENRILISKDGKENQEYEIRDKENEFSKKAVFTLAVMLLVATWAFSSTVEFREKVPVKKRLDLFPLKLGEWYAARRQPLAQIFLEKLDLTDYAMMDYENQNGKIVNFYVAYYESQSKGKSVHSPATCLPGSGWDFRQSGSVKILDPTFNNGSMKVNRAVMQLGRQYQVSYYWFPQRGRILTNAYQLKLYGFWDSLTKQRTDGALVRLVTQAYDDENLEKAEERLQKFMKDIVPVLDEYIPQEVISR